MFWLIFAILSYFFWALVSTIDKYLLMGRIPDAKVYSFYVGVLGISALFLIPFVGFSIPEPSQVALSLLSGALYILAAFSFYNALRLFEVSRVVPAIGGLLPLFTFGLIYFFSQGKETFTPLEFLAFILLISGSVLVVFEREKFVTLKGFQSAALAAFLFSFSFILAKYVYSAQPFWSSFIWMRVGGFLAAICFIFTKEVKEELFKAKAIFQKKTAVLFLASQALGAGAFILLNWAIFLAPLVYLTIINALAGVEYVFLFIFTAILSLKFPQILKEKISGKIIFQKIIAILLISGGLTLLAFK